MGNHNGLTTYVYNGYTSHPETLKFTKTENNPYSNTGANPPINFVYNQNANTSENSFMDKWIYGTWFDHCTTQTNTPTPPFYEIPAPPTNNTTSGSKVTDTSKPEGNVLKLDKNLYGEKFLNEVKDIANEINCDYRDLLAMMYSESGLKTNNANKSSGAQGLIQFMPSIAKQLGTSKEEIAKMTPMEQLKLVRKYYNKIKPLAFSKSHRLTAGELYALNWLPGITKKAVANGGVIAEMGGKYYKVIQGEQFDRKDINHDGKITIDELGQFLIKYNRYVSDKTFLS